MGRGPLGHPYLDPVKWIVAATALAVLLPASEVDACSCVAPRMSRLLVPADGAEAFPTNGILRVYLEAFPERLRADLAREYRLRGPDGEVALRAQVLATRLDLIPTRPLRPSSTYTLEQVFAYDSDGNLISDTERARPRSPTRGAWFPVSRFTTAASAATARARPITLASASFDFRFGGGDCGPGVSLVAETQLPHPLTDSDLLELRVVGLGIVDTVPITNPNVPSMQLHASNMNCNPDPVTIGWSSGLEIEVILRDAAGHELGSTGRQVPAGSPERSGWLRNRSRAGDLPAWSQIRMVQPTVAANEGPQGCPHGFEVVREQDLVEHGGPWMYGARSTLASDGRRAWLGFEESQVGPPARIVRVDGERIRTLSTPAISGIPRALLAGRHGPIILSQTYRSGGGGTNGTLTSLRGVDLHAAWSHDLGDGDAWRVAMGSRRVVAGWRSGGNLTYAMFDARSGSPIQTTVRTGLPIDRGSSEGAALAHVRDRFLFAWTPSRSRTLETLVVDLQGNASDAREIAMTGADIPDMVGAGDRAALVNADRGRIQLAMLDRDGRIASAPRVISTGTDNRIPRVAYNGRFLAVGWETHPRGGAYVVAVDLRGRVSPVLRLDHGERHAGTIGLAPTPDGFLASFTTNYQGTAVLRALRCRADAPMRAPSSIGPD